MRGNRRLDDQLRAVRLLQRKLIEMQMQGQIRVYPQAQLLGRRVEPVADYRGLQLLGELHAKLMGLQGDGCYFVEAQFAALGQAGNVRG